MAEWCRLCGRNIDLVGRVHHCVPIRGGLKPSDFMASKAVDNVTKLPDRYKVSTAAPPAELVDKVDKAAKRKAYKRAWMRKKRSKQGD